MSARIGYLVGASCGLQGAAAAARGNAWLALAFGVLAGACALAATDLVLHHKRGDAA